MKLIILGVPGAGKGTQAVNIAKHYGIDHVSTGDLLRDEMVRKTDIGVSIYDCMNKGQFVQDDIVTELLEKRIGNNGSPNGYILDGFPRTLVQAQILDAKVSDLDKVIKIDIDDSIIVNRMSGRIVCLNCKSVFHRENYPPHKEGVCDKCGRALVQREDDMKPTVIRRLKLYHDLTEPIEDFYRKKGELLEVNGVGEVQEITDAIVQALEVKN